ncbi:hypothetical protein BN12_190030 [Nostocoides japonicum T1-X7]|uniref:Uncharacterized protein n=1 Tax=Nostocoides japonicum T1-X7 TaxID=1194083 RepID=A0A077LX01_9MICO|nr:hypothetical protein [Tetrasphaera japonica]CCH77387.1 hypothetical protein BN12_190030 [Tetrasphaera japonica T1-X7]
MDITMTTWGTESFGGFAACTTPARTLLAPVDASTQGTTVFVTGGVPAARVRVAGLGSGYTPVVHKTIDVAYPRLGAPPV